MLQNTEDFTRLPYYVDIQFASCLASFPLPHLSDPARRQCGSFVETIHILGIIFLAPGLKLHCRVFHNTLWRQV